MDEIIKPLLQYGVLGIFSVLLILFVKDLMKKQDERYSAALQREQARSDSLASENQRLNLMIQEKTIPTLVEATKAMLSTHTLLQSIQYQRDVERAILHGERPEAKKQG